ncbi:hypothetical protein [Pseudonocardia sp. NPDC049635]|uniref:hypothetical protein n=1 Tax=Pseudonocardia sp. NPDC049635 TaxID=3155506 RepID=UPI0033E78ACD
MALADATARFLAQMAESGAAPLHEMTPAEARELGGALRDMYGEGPEVARCTDEAIPVDGGTITARVLLPEDPRAVRSSTTTVAAG